VGYSWHELLIDHGISGKKSFLEHVTLSAEVSFEIQHEQTFIGTAVSFLVLRVDMLPGTFNIASFSYRDEEE
jgi:hypothetical protein